MKKTVFSLFFLLTIWNNLFSIELWNGFTTDMEIDDVKSRINEVFEVDEYYEETDYIELQFKTPGATYYDYPIGYISCILFVKISNQEYYQKGYNLLFSFCHEKLFTIEIWWPSNEGLLDMAIKRYGNYTRFLEPYYSFMGDRYLWVLPDKDFILGNNRFWYIDKKTTEVLRAEEERKRRNKEEEEKKQRQEANAGVKF